MSEPRVSVCIPTYNGEDYLRECIDSVLAQTHRDFEVLVVDDASTDGTVALVESYRSRDERVRLVRNERNLGLVGNWNRSIELARGEWIKFLFQDDFLAPTCLAQMLAAARGPLVVCSRVFLFQGVSPAIEAQYGRVKDKYSIDAAFPGQTWIDAPSLCRAVLRFETANFVGEPTATLIHRDAFKQFGPYDADLIQICDLEFCLRVGVTSGLAYVPEVLATFRVHGSSTTSNNQSRRAFSKDVLDGLKMQYKFAVHPAFQPLRDVAGAVGQDLMHTFHERLLHAQLWGEHWNAPEWSETTRQHPEFRLPLAQRVRRMAKRTAVWMGVRAG